MLLLSLQVLNNNLFIYLGPLAGSGRAQTRPAR